MPRRLRRPPATPARRKGRIVPAAAVTALALVLTGCDVRFGQTRGVTNQSHLEFRLWFWMMVAGIAVAVFVWALIFWAVFAYRRKDDRIPKQFFEHIGLEVTYTIVPLLMVLVIFGFTFVVENNIDNVLKPPQVILDVTAYQWGWIFQYSKPGPNSHINCPTAPARDCVTIETAPNAAPSALAQPYTSAIYPQLVLPADETVRVFLRSHDVIHGFYVHAFNFSRYAQPGVVNSFEFSPTTTGIFPGQCTQYCGLYHSEMLFSVKIVTPSQFQVWFSQQEQKLKTQATLQSRVTGSGARQS
ncbi:MAG: cytochrome c oxidase subunit II [Acidimicrobiales bacterium]|jgi:cytochrome c oxidase subunit 2